MSDTAEQKFSQYDFTSSDSWKEYFNNLFPTPSHDKVLKLKRKWFKKNVDSALEVETGIPSESASSQNTSNTQQSTSTESNNANSNQSQSSQPSGSQNAPAPGGFLGKVIKIVGAPLGKIIDIVYRSVLGMKDKFYFLEGILKVVFIFAALLLPAFANMIAFNVCLLGFFRQTGKPRFDVEYGRKALQNEFLQNILYMIPFAFFPNSKSLVYYLPLGIHFWIGFCEFVNLRLPNLYPKIAKFADPTRQNRGILMYQKAKLEIMLFVFSLFLIFFGGSNLILLVFYGNFLKTKYLINNLTKSAFQEINNWIEGKMNTPYCPGIVKLIVNKVRAFCAYLVKV